MNYSAFNNPALSKEHQKPLGISVFEAAMAAEENMPFRTTFLILSQLTKKFTECWQ